VGEVTSPTDVMLFNSILYAGLSPLDQTLSALKKKYGDTIYESEPLPFAYTSYYEQEMGSPIFRMIIAFSRLAPRDSLPDIKLHTNSIEDSLSHQGRRTVNIDPGLLSNENVCLATTKPYSHRIYLRKGIWAEITLVYREKSYRKLEWTYPDYGSEELIQIFNKIRTLYRERLQCQEV